jgi:drug/metabolite transporter superfamily protein YnfA
VGHLSSDRYASSSTAFRPDRHDVIGGDICLLGVAIIMYAPRSVG